jgi:ribosomal protein S18 acetylase RimI-like enzyme
MNIRPVDPRDLMRLVELTIETFGPFYEDHFRPSVGEVIFAHQHGNWAQDYRDLVPTLHDPATGRYVAVAEADDGSIAGYVGYVVDPARRHGDIDILAVESQRRRHQTGTALCEHAFADMRARGVEVVGIGTGGDPFHAPARALYESLGCSPVPQMGYLKAL